MDRWKAAFFTLLIVLILSTIVFGYFIIGQSYTIAYLKESRFGYKQDLITVSEIINSNDRSKKNVVKILARHEIIFDQSSTADSVELNQSIITFESENFQKLLPVSD
jgi:uncharacterized protein (DUF934 family)